MSILDRIADRLDRRILRRHGSVRADEPYPPVCTAHDKPQPWPCDDWFRAVARIRARRHSGDPS